MEKTITIKEFERFQFCNSPKLPQLINDNGRRKRWVGIGWVDEGELQGNETSIVKKGK